MKNFNFNEDAIREAAYYIWKNAGCPANSSLHDWNAAIEQLSLASKNCCNSNKISSLKTSSLKTTSLKSASLKKSTSKTSNSKTKSAKKSK